MLDLTNLIKRFAKVKKPIANELKTSKSSKSKLNVKIVIRSL